MNKEQTKNIVELWNEVGERPSYMNDEESPYYPRRDFLRMVLENILGQEFPSVTGHQLEDQSFIPRQVKLSGDLTSPKYVDPSVTLDDFRSNFDWDEEYIVEITYPYLVELSISDEESCSSKREVVNVLGGSETDWEGNHEPFSRSDSLYGGYNDLSVEGIQHDYVVRVSNLRLKESVVEKTNVSST